MRIAAFANLLLVAASLSAQQSPVTMPSASSMPPPEIPIGVVAHPFHAVIDADWTGVGGSNSSSPTKARGEIWRDATGDVRLKIIAMRNSPSSPQPPTWATVIRADDKTQTSWSSASTNALSIHLTEYPKSIFEDTIIPKTVTTSRPFFSYECRKKGARCNAAPLGERTIDSVSANGTRYTAVIPATSLGAADDLVLTRDVWIDSEKNVVMLIEDVDPRFGTFTMRLSSVSRGEQNSALFRAPDGYKIKTITPFPSTPMPSLPPASM
jgi:hypothetical protein